MILLQNVHLKILSKLGVALQKFWLTFNIFPIIKICARIKNVI